MATNGLTMISLLCPGGLFRISDPRLAYKEIIKVKRNNKIYYQVEHSPGEGEVLQDDADGELIFNFNETFARPVIPSVQYLEKVFVIYKT